MVGFPHRPDAGVDEGAKLTAALVESGGEIVEARAEVGSREQRVHDHADEHRHRHHRSQRHDTVSSCGGPYGLGRSVSPVRHLFAMERNTTYAPTVMPR